MCSPTVLLSRRANSAQRQGPFLLEASSFRWSPGTLGLQPYHSHLCLHLYMAFFPMSLSRSPFYKDPNHWNRVHSDPVPAPSGTVVKNLPAVQERQETRVPSLGRDDPLEKGMATHCSILAGESHGRRSLAGYRPLGRTEPDTTEATFRVSPRTNH